MFQYLKKHIGPCQTLRKLTSWCGACLKCFLCAIIFLACFFKLEAATSTIVKLSGQGSSVQLTPFGTCYQITNNSSKQILVPLKTSGEFTKFLNHLPYGITSGSCSAYDWSIGTLGACSGGSGAWSFSTIGSCTGGTASYSYDSWSTCSKTCGGGTQTRNNLGFAWDSSSGTQTVSGGTCTLNTNSGTQARTVVCVRSSDGATIADHYCSGAKPSTSQSCTPTDTSICGTAPTSRSCTPSSGIPSSSDSAITSQSCNTQICQCAANAVNVTSPNGLATCNFSWGIITPPTILWVGSGVSVTGGTGSGAAWCASSNYQSAYNLVCGNPTDCNTGSNVFDSADGSAHCTFNWPQTPAGGSASVSGTSGGTASGSCSVINGAGVWQYTTNCPNASGTASCTGGSMPVNSTATSGKVCTCTWSAASVGTTVSGTCDSGGSISATCGSGGTWGGISPSCP